MALDEQLAEIFTLATLIINRTDRIDKRLDRMEGRLMATLADLDAEIAGELTTAVNQIESTLTTLEQNIANGSDTSAEIASLHSLAQGLQAAVASAGATPTGAPVATTPGTITAPTGATPVAGVPTNAASPTDALAGTPKL